MAKINKGHQRYVFVAEESLINELGKLGKTQKGVNLLINNILTNYVSETLKYDIKITYKKNKDFTFFEFIKENKYKLDFLTEKEVFELFILKQAGFKVSWFMASIYKAYKKVNSYVKINKGTDVPLTTIRRNVLKYDEFLKKLKFEFNYAPNTNI